VDFPCSSFNARYFLGRSFSFGTSIDWSMAVPRRLTPGTPQADAICMAPFAMQLPSSTPAKRHFFPFNSRIFLRCSSKASWMFLIT
jgi:hypothetical protein